MGFGHGRPCVLLLLWARSTSSFMLLPIAHIRQFVTRFLHILLEPGIFSIAYQTSFLAFTQSKKHTYTMHYTLIVLLPSSRHCLQRLKRKEEKITLNLIFKNLTNLFLDPFYIISCEIEVEKRSGKNRHFFASQKCRIRDQ